MTKARPLLYLLLACAAGSGFGQLPQASAQTRKIPVVDVDVRLAIPELLWWGGAPGREGLVAQIPRVSLEKFDLRETVALGMLSALNKDGRIKSRLKDGADEAVADYLVLVDIGFFRFDRAMRKGVYIDCVVETRLTDRAGKKLWSGGYDPRSSLTLSPLGVRVQGEEEELQREPALTSIKAGVRELIDKLCQRTAKDVARRLAPTN
jgi:hypothetical protein